MSTLSKPNPFVGPRSIQQGEPFFGRSTEQQELFHRLQARRIVVLHAPSGAGKSSLVQAGLIPLLKEANFDVWKPIRVNLDPHSLEGIAAGTNRYLLSALVSLEDELRAERRRSPAELAKLDLVTYLQSRPRRKGWEGRPVVLLFDQFEEVLTTAPQEIQQKRDFFDAVGKALENENVWALFILRDDYLAAFAPYRERIPTQLSTTFRIDLLGLEGAKEVAENLALQGGRAFPAAEQLVRDLAAISVQQSDGTVVSEAGQYVEPVQLQVVCRRLWDALPENDDSIDEADITQYASVSTALADYYAQVLGKIAAGNVSVQRAVREWVGQKLIVGAIRSQVRKGPATSAGLDNGVIDQLVGSFLVRAEPRAGATWFELSHDRLVKPIEENNKAWEQEILQSFQVQARLWESAQRGPGQLLGREALSEAEAWASKNATLVTDGERAFLKQSRELRDREQKEQKRLVALLAVAIAAAIVMAFAVIGALRAQNKAKSAEADATSALKLAKEKEGRAKTAEADAKRASLMAGAREFLAVGPPGTAALLLAEVNEPDKARGWFELATSALESGGIEVTLPHDSPVARAAWSPDGKRIVTVSNYKARVWNADGSGIPVVLNAHDDGDAIMPVAWSPDSKRIVTGSYDGPVRVWDADGSGILVELMKGHEQVPHADFVGYAAWSPDGKRIVTGFVGGAVQVWNADGSGKPMKLKGHTDGVLSAAWSPDGQRIVTASEDKTARVWNADGSGKPVVLTGHDGWVYSAAWSPDGKRIVTASRDKTARVWNADGSGKPVVLEGHDGSVLSAAWSPDGKRIITASEDRTARVWNADGSGKPDVIFGHEARLLSTAWSSDGKRIVMASMDGQVRILSADVEGGRLVELKASWQWQLNVALSPDGKRILTTSADKTLRLWNNDGASNPIVFANGRGTGKFWWSPDGKRVLASGRTAVKRRSAEATRSARISNADGSGDPVQLDVRGDFDDAQWSPDGKRIVMLSAECIIRNADDSGEPVVLQNENKPIECSYASWSPGGNRFITTTRHGNTALVWNADGSGKPVVLKLEKDGGKFTSAAWSHDNKRIVTASRDNIARVWNADGSGEPVILKGHTGALNTVAWSPDGKRIVTASYDKTARVWNADAGGAPLYTFKDHTESVNSAAWSPDSTRVVTTSWDKTARVWNADGSGTPMILRGHDDFIESAAWSPNGKRIVTASQDGTIRVWNADGSGNPWVIKALRPASWSLDGTRILTGSGTYEARSYLVDITLLKEALRHTTTECLSADQRQTYLLDSESDARTHYETCERDHGRIPRAPAVPSGN